MKIKEIPNVSKELPFIENILSGIAKPITWALTKTTSITATQVTLLSMGFALLSALLSVFGLFVWGFISFCVFILLDHVDGQVARVRGTQGPSGVYLDSRAHYIVEPLFFIGLGVGSFYKIANTNELLGLLYLIAGIFTALFYLMRQTMKVEGLMDTQIRNMKSESKLSGKINYFLFDFIRINNPFGFMLFAIVFDFVGPALIIYATLFKANVLYSFYKNYNNLKEVKK